MTTPSDESDNRGENAGDSDQDRPSGVYRRPRRRGGQDTRFEAGAQNETPASSTQDSEPDRSDGIYAPPKRRSVRRDGQESGPGIFSRITGRHRLDEIRVARYEPYAYESNQQNTKWATIIMGVWCLVVAWLALTDYSNSRNYQEWVDRGIDKIPPSADLAQQIEPSTTFAQREGGEAFKCAYLGGRISTDECPDGETDALLVHQFVEESGAICTNFGEYTEPTPEPIPDDEAVTTGIPTEESEPVEICTAVWSYFPLLEFAKQTNLNCPDVQAILSSIATDGRENADCEFAFTYAEDFQSSQDRSRLLWLLVVFLVVLVAFPYLSVIHRASRNLLTLKSEQQKHTPEWAVLHHFLPILNFFRPGQVMKEMFKGSDPSVDPADPTAWKKQGKTPAIVWLWWILWVASWLFNPITVPRYVNAQTLSELVEANNLLILSDVLLIILGVSAVLMLRQLHAWQELRFAKVGPITVTPPPPVDPLAEALKKQEDKQREKEEKKKRRGR